MRLPNPVEDDGAIIVVGYDTLIPERRLAISQNLRPPMAADSSVHDQSYHITRSKRSMRPDWMLLHFTHQRSGKDVAANKLKETAYNFNLRRKVLRIAAGRRGIIRFRTTAL